MSKQSRLTGALSLVAAQAVVLVLGYVTHLWIGRVLGPAPYGIYGVVLSLQSIVGLLLTLGVPVAVSRYVAQDEEHAASILQQALRIQTVIALLVGAVVIGSSTALARTLGDSGLVSYIRFTALIIFFQAYYPVFVQYLSGLHRFNRQALLTAVYAVVKLLGALLLIYWFQVYGAFAGFAIGGAFAGLLGWFWAKRVGGRQPKVIPYRHFLQFAGTYVLILVGLQILISLDLFMVKALLKDDVTAGFYNAAVSLSRISYMLLQGLAFILLPSVASLTKPGASHDSAASFIAQAIRYLIALTVPSIALAAATSRPLVTLFFSEQYLPAAPVLTVLMVGVGCLAFYLLLTNIVAGAGRPFLVLILTLILLLVSTLLGLYLIPQFGLVGAAWQTTITGLVGLFALGSYTFRAFKIPLPLRSTVNVILATFIAVSLTYFWIPTPLTLAPEYIVIGIVYVAALWLLGEVTANDKSRLASLHPRLRWVEKI